MCVIHRYFLPGNHIFFFNDTATTEIYTLSLHDALPIWLQIRTQAIHGLSLLRSVESPHSRFLRRAQSRKNTDRKSTRLNSSHPSISYAVFCLKKKTMPTTPYPTVH